MFINFLLEVGFHPSVRHQKLIFPRTLTLASETESQLMKKKKTYYLASLFCSASLFIFSHCSMHVQTGWHPNSALFCLANQEHRKAAPMRTPAPDPRLEACWGRQTILPWKSHINVHLTSSSKGFLIKVKGEPMEYYVPSGWTQPNLKRSRIGHVSQGLWKQPLP